MDFKKTIFLFVLAFVFNKLIAQPISNEIQDTTCNLQHALKNGQFQAKIRSYSMATDNAKSLTDFWAQGIAFSMHYESRSWKGFQIGFGGSHVFNLASSDLSKPDSTTGLFNRYEIGLFDVTDPRNRKNMSRLEELYLRYRLKNTVITAGRQSIQTPFINPQDGRLRPTFVEGIRVNSSLKNGLKLQAGWIYGISVRGTQRFDPIDRSVGIYPQGVQSDGIRSSYYNQLKSKGVFTIGIEKQFNQQATVRLWNQWVENIFNVAMAEVDASLYQGENGKLTLSTQFIRQDAVHEGGSVDPAHAYLVRGSGSNAFGMKVQWTQQNLDCIWAYTRITSKDRTLLPREWGREPFYTFLSRERNEGYGDVHAFMFRSDQHFRKKRLRVSEGLGYYRLPDVKDFRLNKYGFPAYVQANLDVRYLFEGALKGMDAQILIVGKKRIGEDYGNPRYTLNKVNMILYNFIINYSF